MFYSPRTRYIALFSIIVSTFMTSSLATSFSVHDVKMRSSNRHTSGTDKHHQAPTVAHHLMMNSLRGGEGNAIQNLYGKYMSSLETSPLTTKSITAGVVQALGDFLSQYIEAKVAKVPFVLNGSRLRAFLISGVFFVGPFLHYWYSFLWRIGTWAEVKYKAGKKVQTLLQVFTDQTLGVAVFFPLFFYVYELSEALSSWRVPAMAVAHGKLKEELANVFLTQYYIWPITNWCNFAYVPENLRVLFSNIVSVFWNAYLCSKLAK